MKPQYDSTNDTLNHIKRVNELLVEFAQEILRRAVAHDLTKLSSPEKELFDEFTPKLKNSVYGSPEYKQFLSALKPALDHHYQHNSHHPEHYDKGVDEMDLYDLVEMFIDWKAAGERHSTGSIIRSIEVNHDRFNLQSQLVLILINHANRNGWK